MCADHCDCLPFPIAQLPCSVQLTIVDQTGRRHVVRGTTGQSVVDVLEGHMGTLGEDGTHH